MLYSLTDSSHVGLLVHHQHTCSFMPQLPEQLSSAIQPDPATLVNGIRCPLRQNSSSSFDMAFLRRLSCPLLSVCRQPSVLADYHKNVIDHYENPRNVGALDKEDSKVGTGLVGAPACGDVMKLQIKVDDDGRIADAKFKTFGCGSAIASSSLATEWVKGKTIDEALKIKNSDIANELCLPPVKLHCSMLAEDAIKAALSNYREKQKKGPKEQQQDTV
uniref:Iron-sulfur cluster assembly enzyme ISCU n=1 Tax=Eptatretus burgeri TaxID=7764 RepID=A0A8C4QCB2_EPTBU